VNAELFSISRSSTRDCEIVSLEGELDLVGAPAVSDTLDALADSTRPVVVDLSRLTFIDSSGIHAILSPRPQQGTVVLVSPADSNVRRVLEMARIDRALPVHDTLDDALAGAT
jgi:anti-sigma B factor antagonist